VEACSHLGDVLGHMLHHAAADEVIAAVEELSAGAGAHSFKSASQAWTKPLNDNGMATSCPPASANESLPTPEAARNFFSRWTQ